MMLMSHNAAAFGSSSGRSFGPAKHSRGLPLPRPTVAVRAASRRGGGGSGGDGHHHHANGGGDSGAPVEPETDFDRETAALALRMLTARATSVVLQNVGQVDTFKAQWLQDWIETHPPIEGDAFLRGLMEARPVYLREGFSGGGGSGPAASASASSFSPGGGGGAGGVVQCVNPAQLAAAVLATREALARKLAGSLADRVSDANIGVLREHLQQHTYTSGSDEGRRPSWRLQPPQQRRRHAQMG